MFALCQVRPLIDGRWEGRRFVEFGSRTIAKNVYFACPINVGFADFIGGESCAVVGAGKNVVWIAAPAPRSVIVSVVFFGVEAGLTRNGRLGQ